MGLATEENQPMNLWRLYFNKREAFPQVWSVDNGAPSSEIHVQWVHIVDACVTTRVNMDAVPCVWIEIVANATFRDGGVLLNGSARSRNLK